MKSFNYIFAFAFVVLFSGQCMGAQIGERKLKTRLGVIVENGAAISNTLFGSFVEALDKIQPNLVNILNEMSPEVQVVLYGVLGMTKAKFGEEQKRVEEFFLSLVESLEKLQPIETCTNEFSPKFNEMTDSFATDLLETLLAVLERNEKDLENVKAGSKVIMTKARELFEKVISVPECLYPGNKEASSCLGDGIEEVIQGLVDVFANSNLLGESLRDVLETLVSEVLSDSIPVLLQMLGELLSALEDLGECVSGLQ